MILAGTGHRPDKLGGYHPSVTDNLTALARVMITKLKPSHIISGMALGWDQALAQSAVDMDIPFTAAVPFKDQDNRWPEDSRTKYKSLLLKADKVVTVSPGGFTAAKMQIRNEWMVDRCDVLLALWDGSPGGTGNCIQYAKKVNAKIVNIWDIYESRYLKR